MDLSAKASKDVKEKKPASFMLDIKSENDWRSLCKKDGLIVVNVYPGWAGACVSMNNFLKKIKADIDNPKLIFATACSDHITELAVFRDQSQPTWLFLGAGKPVKVVRGTHVLHLAKDIKDEFEHEMQCVEGKAKRNVISLSGDGKKNMEGGEE